MGRAKPTKGQTEAKRPSARKLPMDESARVRDLEKRLAEALGQLQARDRELAEAQEQQTATADILRVISSSPTHIQPMLDAVAENAARVCGATDAVIFRIEGDLLHPVAHHGSIWSGLPIAPFSISRQTIPGRAVLERRTLHFEDVTALLDAEFPASKERIVASGSRTVMATPLLREGIPIGVIHIRRTDARPFSDKQIELLRTFADQAVIAIENVRLFNETKERLEQQTATSEILQVISQSPTDVQPVFDAIVRTGTQLCEASLGFALRYDGQLMTLVANHNATNQEIDA